MGIIEDYSKSKNKNKNGVFKIKYKMEDIEVIFVDDKIFNMFKKE